MPKFKIDCDYFQFHIMDSSTSRGALTDAWNAEALQHNLATADGIIGVGTVRNTSVFVDVTVADAEPAPTGIETWDRIVDAGIAVPSGELVLTSPTWEIGERLQVVPGDYRVRVHCGNTVASKVKGSRLRERYKIVLWPDDIGSVRVIKNLD